MAKRDLGKIFGVLANVGVLLSILLLTYELAQNRQMMQAQTRNDLNNGLTNFLIFAADREFHELMLRKEAGEELSELDELVLETRMATQLRYFENVHYQYRAGMFAEDEFAAQRTRWRAIFASKPRAEYWCRTRDVYVAEFVAEIDRLLTMHQCE